MKILGITVDDRLTFSTHVDTLISKGLQNIHAIKFLKNHGLQPPLLFNVASSLFISCLTYASPAWWGFLSISDINKIESLIKKAKKWGLMNLNHNDFKTLCKTTDNNIFHQITSNTSHSLYKLLPPRITHQYTLRTRPHNFSLPSGLTHTQKKTFIFRMLFKNMY